MYHVIKTQSEEFVLATTDVDKALMRARKILLKEGVSVTIETEENYDTLIA